MASVYIKTYGCQMNERDSEAVAAQLVAQGHTLAASEKEAEVVLLNTCSVRDNAEQKALNKMRNLAVETRRRRPGTILGFLGCMAQSRGEELAAQFPGVSLVLGTQKFHRAATHLDELLSGRQQVVVDVRAEPGSERAVREHLPANLGPRRGVTALVSIMQGCNQYCTFCIVPYTRGLERSRPIPEIVEECRELVRAGVREVTLLGQIVTSYGRREVRMRGDRSAFVQLLEAVDAVEGLERIRFTAPHPKGYGEDLVAAYRRLPKLCEYAHVPVQSGSDRILQRMHRGYTRRRYLELVGQLRAARPEIGLCTDLIVGFPGETEEDFMETCSLVREVEFDQAYVFKYSARRDTPAARMDGALSAEVIEERHGRLLAEVDAAGAKRYARLVGHEVEVLVEGPSRRNKHRLEGRTRCNKIVVFDGDPALVGRSVRLRVSRAGTFTLYGDLPATRLH